MRDRSTSRHRVPALVLLAGVFILHNSWARRGYETERQAAPAEIRLLQPRGSVAAAPRDFRWARQEDVESCRLEVYDQNLDLVYRSAALAAGAVSLPEEALAKLQAGRTYFWKVTATLKDRQTIESEFAKFVFQK